MVFTIMKAQRCFPGGKESACSAGDSGDVSWGGWIPRPGRSPGEGMATHSSILAWGIPWTEEPGGLKSVGSQRVRHNWMTNTFTFTFTTMKSGGWDHVRNTF